MDKLDWVFSLEKSSTAATMEAVYHESAKNLDRTILQTLTRKIGILVHENRTMGRSIFSLHSKQFVRLLFRERTEWFNYSPFYSTNVHSLFYPTNQTSQNCPIISGKTNYVLLYSFQN